MKKVSLLLALAVALVALPSAPAYADASSTGCEHSDNRAAGCSGDPADPASVPEPNSVALLAIGLAAVSGLAVALRRKRATQV
jgi:hypothetical protein